MAKPKIISGGRIANRVKMYRLSGCTFTEAAIKRWLLLPEDDRIKVGHAVKPTTTYAAAMKKRVVQQVAKKSGLKLEQVVKLAQFESRLYW